MNFQQMKSIIEALLFVSGDEGLSAKEISEVLEQEPDMIRDVVHDMKNDYRRQHRGLQIIEIADAYQLATLPAHAPYFERLAATPSRGTLSQAALETLAIVAYRQPITRIAVEEVRGVKSDRAIQTLVAKQLIEEVGRADVIGKPILYGTTKLFLDYFALRSLKDLPDTASFENALNLEEEARMLFDTMAERQMTIDDVTAETDLSK